MISQPASIVRNVVLILAVVSGSVACSSNQATRAEPGSQSSAVIHQAHGAAARSSDRSAIGRRAATVALEQVGAPYRYGGSTPSGFDCSGLVHYSYANAGKSIPRTTTGLWTALAPVDARQIRTGDLLFFRISGKMSHVGMYLGDGRFVHAPSTGRVVAVESLESDYYRRALIRAGRPR
ncbi:MAG: C40 family peptidase [Gammaproteobacteria bacterium]|nr:C40 family peptidase [Gammaproteobacteria bacterium]